MALWLSEADVRSLLSMNDLIDGMQRALIAYSSGKVNQPVRTVIQAPGGIFASMPAYLDEPKSMGAKLVTVFHENESKGLPSHLATILLLDPATGATLAVLDGRYITEVRTAAVSAVAARFLSLPAARTLAIVGSGVQAGSHLKALTLVRQFEEIRCWSPTASKRDGFVASQSAAFPIRAAATAEQAVRGADVIALVTSSSTPVIDDAWIKPGACVLSVGACLPSWREMDPALVTRARLIVDSRASALKESGDVVQGIREGRFTGEHIAAELGEVAARPELARTTDDEVTVFKSLGLAVEDVVAADLAFRRACQAGKGVRID